MITKEQANSIIEAMQNDDGDTLKGILSGLIESNQMTKDEANSLIGSMQADDGNAVMDQLKGMIGDEIPRPPIPDVVAPDVLETMKQQALESGDISDDIALNLFPTTAKNIAEGASAPMLVGSALYDVPSSAGRGLLSLGKAVLGNESDPYAMMKKRGGIDLNPDQPWYSLENLGNIAGGMGESILTDPTTPFTMGFASLGKSVASKLPMAYQSSRLAKIGTGAVEGAVAGGAQGGASNLLEQGANPFEGYDVSSLGKAIGIGAGGGGLIGGTMGGFGISKPNYVENMPQTQKRLDQFLAQKSPEYKSLADEIAQQKTGLTKSELEMFPPKAKPAIMNMTEETQKDLVNFVNLETKSQHEGYGGQDIYDKVWTDFVKPMGDALESNRKSMGEEINRIEGDLGSAPISSAKTTEMISTLKKSIREKLKYDVEMKPIQAESGLLDAQGKPIMTTTGFEYNLKPIEGGAVGKGLEEVKAIVADAMETLTKNPTPQALRNLDLRLGDKLQSAQPELIPVMKKTKGALKDLETAVENGLIDEIGQRLGSEERKLYSESMKRYGQIRDAEKLLNTKGGRATEFTTSAGEDLYGSTKGASSLNAGLNPADRGVRFIRDIAVKEYGIKDPLEQMALAHYAKEIAGTKAKSFSQTPEPKSTTQKLISAIKGEATTRSALDEKIINRNIKKVRPERYKKTVALGKVLSGTGLSESDKKKLELTRSIREGIFR